ncbi:unnamed protein product [Rhizophagus irregularis]|nr:unnamed protein product [Rhizophagus irregularis]
MRLNYYSTNIKMFGISQNPDTKNYTIVLLDKDYCLLCQNIYTDRKYKWCKQCEINKLRKNFTNWTSGNEKIDNFIQEKQLVINHYNNSIFEWIPYNKFLDIEEVDKDDFSTVYSAKWEDGPLEWNYNSRKYIRNPKEVELKEIKLKHSYNLQDVKVYSTNFKVFGISQNPDTKNYIIALQNNYSYCIKCNNIYTNISYKWCKKCEINKSRKNFTNWTSGNEKIDNFIQEKQLKFNYPHNIVFEWIPYNKFLNIKEVNKDGFSAVYLAQWKDGPLYWDENSNKYIREPEMVALKCPYDSQNIDNFLNKVETYLINFEIYGVSQNPDTKNYIMVLQDKNYCIICNYKYTDINYKWCKHCETNKLITNWTSGNKKIDGFIQEKQLENNHYSDTIFEWIPYNQFSDIKEIGTHDHITVYLAKWKKWPQESLTFFEKLLLFKEQNTTNEFLNKVKRYFTVNGNKIYGISQNPNSKEYLVILNGGCVDCGEIYTNILYGWCNLCYISSFKNNFVNRTSGNELIDNFIQKMKLKVKKYDDIIFEWIPYNQFIDVKEIGQSDFTTVYLANGKMVH